MSWNLLHVARILKDAGGIPAYGNSTHDWDLSHADHPRVPLNQRSAATAVAAPSSDSDVILT